MTQQCINNTSNYSHLQIMSFDFTKFVQQLKQPGSIKSTGCPIDSTTPEMLSSETIAFNLHNYSYIKTISYTKTPNGWLMDTP